MWLLLAIYNCFRVQRCPAGYVNPQKLLTVVQAACGAFLDVERQLTARGLRLFMLGSRYRFSPQLFERAAVEFPMRQRSSFTGVGHTLSLIHI